MNTTQDECKNMWHMLKKNILDRSPNEFIARIDYINELTPWSEVEPRWWLEMMKVRAKYTELMRYIREG